MTLPIGNVNSSLVLPFWLAYLDFDGDPLYASTLPQSYTPSGTGDPDLDGKTYLSLPSELVQVSPIAHSENGSEAVELVLSGLPTANQDLLDIIADPTKWRGRLVRVWKGVTNGSFAPSVLAHEHTGYMMAISLSGDADGQTIRLATENYLSAFSTPRRRTYQDQAEHDATDNSAARIRAAANGIQSAGGFLPGTTPVWQQPGGWDFGQFGMFF
jgi:hypothetical protein